MISHCFQIGTVPTAGYPDRANLGQGTPATVDDPERGSGGIWRPSTVRRDGLRSIRNCWSECWLWARGGGECGNYRKSGVEQSRVNGVVLTEVVLPSFV